MVVAPKVKPAVSQPRTASDDVADVASVTGAVIAELSASDAINSSAGLAAVRLAQLIDAATTMNGSSVAAWSREMRAAMVDAKAESPDAEIDPIDELERKRAARGA